MSTLNETSLLSVSENFIVKNLCNLEEYSIDIGAARGDFASQMSLYSKFVFAIEPNPIKIKQLIVSRKNIQLFENAASSIHGKNVELRVVSATPANSTIEILNKLEGFDGIEFRNVKTIKIDEICKHSTSFMKIDCEGGEYDILTEENFDWIYNNVGHIAVEVHRRHADSGNRDMIKFRNEFLKKYEDEGRLKYQNENHRKGMWNDELILASDWWNLPSEFMAYFIKK